MIDYEMVAGTFRLAAKKHFVTSNLWSSIAARIAEDPDVLAIAQESTPGAFPPFLLLAAVHSLVLADPGCKLAKFFPTVSRDPIPDSDPYPVFKDFALGACKQISSIIQSAHVNKTVVKRSACLRALLVNVARKNRWDQVHIIDFGCSAGLNLLLDHWRITYGDFGTEGPQTATVHFSIEMRGGDYLPSGELPVILSRSGIDIDRFDLTNESHERWLLGNLFPDHTEIFELTKQAFSVLRSYPPRYVTGNAKYALAKILAKLPESEPVVVMNSFVLPSLSSDQRKSFHQTLHQARKFRPIARISMEILGNNAALMIDDLDGEGYTRVGESDDDATWMCWYP